MKDLISTDPIFYTNLIMLILWVILFAFMCYALYRTHKTEKRRKEYVHQMKICDRVYTPVSSGNIEGEILEIKDDNVIMVIKVHKSRIYPQ